MRVCRSNPGSVVLGALCFSPVLWRNCQREHLVALEVFLVEPGEFRVLLKVSWQDYPTAMLPHKRKHKQTTAIRSRQAKLTHMFAVKERCPHCAAQFDTLELLIQHAEAVHFTDDHPASADEHYADAAATSLTESQSALTSVQHADQQVQHQHHQLLQQSQPTTGLQPWWKAAPEDPVVAHIRFSNATGSAGSQALQPVRLSVLSSLAPVELVLQALPGALASRLLTELQVHSSSWVAGSWWFGGQQQTAPRCSATFTLQEPQVSTSPPSTIPTSSTHQGAVEDSLGAAAPCQHLAQPDHTIQTRVKQQQQQGPGVHQQQSATALAPLPHTAPLDNQRDTQNDHSAHQQQFLQQQQQHNQHQDQLLQQHHNQHQHDAQQLLQQRHQQQTSHQGSPSTQHPEPAAAAVAAQQDQPVSAAATDLSSLPQLPASASLQQAADLISQAVNARSNTPQHKYWQQQREALTKKLTAAAAAAAAGAEKGIRRVDYAAVGSTSGSRSVPVVHCAPPPAPPAAARAVVSGGFEDTEEPMPAETTALLPQQPQQQQPYYQQQQQPVSQAGGSESVRSWRPSYVLANLYKDGQQSVGSHSDRLSSLGPLPTIASVSLGAARVFRLHPANTTVATAAAAASGSGGSGRLVSSVDIHLPHNSLLIMWPPTQEEWKHEVPKTKSVTSHPLSGPARINLTFRQLQPAWAAAVPHCRCGRPAIMRCALQHSSFAYYYACDNTQGPGCGLYQLAVVLDSRGRGRASSSRA